MSLLRHLTRNLARIPTGTACKILPTKCMSTLTRAPSSGLLRRSIPTHERIATCNLTTEGDKDMRKFLSEEISYEKEQKHVRPSFNNFDVSEDGMLVTLSREDQVTGEVVCVEFDVNESTNIDESDEIDEELGDEPSSSIVSYPNFDVTIEKACGTILTCKCVYDQDSQSDYDEHADAVIEDIDEEPSAASPFRIDSVSISQEEEVSVYESETTNMDGDLYDKLMTTLSERGIDQDFSESLLKLSSAIEHEQYIVFLQNLEGFAKGK